MALQTITEHFPCKAEEHIRSDFVEILTTEIKSTVVPTLMMKKLTEQFTCPKCSTKYYETKVLQHGQSYKCKCGLKFQSYGNSLHLWK